MKRRGIHKVSLFILTFFIFNLLSCGFIGINSAQSADLLSSYNILKKQYPDYINKMVAGGATEAQIESFLVDLDADVRSRGELNEGNFNNLMYQSLQEVIQERKHRAVFRAMLSQFEEEITYTLENNNLHPNLVPLRNAVKDSVLGTPTQNPPSEEKNSSVPGGGGGPGNSTDRLTQAIKDQLKAAGNTITVSTSSRTTSLKGDIIQQVRSSGKNLEITINSVKFIIPPKAINIANDETVTIAATALNRSSATSSLQNMATGQQMLGQVYDLNCSTEASVSGLNFEQAVDVTLSYSVTNIKGINEDLLDVYYYDETKKAWIPMKGTVDQDKNTITFTTSHFSKYAVMTRAEKKVSTQPKPEPLPTTGAEKFTDITGHWAVAEIDQAVKLGIASGMSPTEFAPNRNITRAQFATLLTRALGIKNTACVQSRFKDVPTDAWYFNAVNSAAEAGLVSGYSPTTFGPDDLITREQIAVMINNALVYKNKQVNSSNAVLEKFKDRGEISTWAISGVSTAIQQGIITGRSADTIAPGQNATRAEGTAMILRMYKLL